MKKCISGLFLLLLSCSIISSGSFAEAKHEKGKFTLELKDGLISIQAESVNFKEILRELEGKTGIKVEIFEGIDDKEVSLDIKSFPIPAIRTILKRISLRNFAVVYDQQLASIAVYILPEGKDISQVIKGKSVIRHRVFPSGETIDRIKGRAIVSITKGKNKIPIRYVKDEVLLKFHLGVSKEEIEEILKKYKLVKVSDDTLSRIGYVKVRIPDGRDVISVIKEIRKEYKIKIPEPNYVLNVLAISDPLFNLQWYIPDTNFDSAWDKLKSNDTIKVAVIDSGVDAGHPDLVGRISKGVDYVNADTDASDDHGHGTFVSGIIAATANNIGIKGLNDNTEIIPVKVIDASGFGTYEDVAGGIIYAADNNAKVINLSIGGYAYSFMLQEAVDYAFEKGCIVVAAGGNDGIKQEIYPAAYPDVLGVSALGYDGEIWSYSNSGKHIDVCAPGANIISTGLGNNYVYASGTSASAPMVSALAAMLVSEKPDLSSSFIQRLIVQTATDLGEKGWDQIYGAGEIDAQAAIKQKVKPFHDVAVTSVHIEPMAFEKEKPTYIVASIENAGTYKSEECDVVLYEIIGEEKLEVGKEEAVAVLDKLKVIFDWKPESLQENTRLEITIFSEEDENTSNNSKTTYSFFIEESNGLYILYKNKPYVHSWVALQAYNILPSGELKSEMTNSTLYGGATYDQLFGSSRIWEDDYEVPDSWSTDRKSGSSLFEGTWEEDEDDYDILDGVKDGYFRHFWEPDQGYDYGLDTILTGRNHSALYQAEYWWDKAISAYATNTSLAYYYLGRVVHLLGDMGVTEHVHNDLHPGSPDNPLGQFFLDKDDYSNYEEYTKIYYRNYTGSGSPKSIDSLPLNLPSSYVPTNYDTKLAKLFYNMAQYTQHFDSSNPDSIYGDNDSSNGDGNNKGYGGETINMGISPDSGNNNQAYKAIAYLNEGNDRIDPGTTLTIIWQKYKVIGGYYDYETLYEGPYVDSTYYVDISRGYGQVSYSDGLWDEQNNTLDRLKITYTYRGLSNTDYITNPKDNPYYYSVPDHYIDDQANKIFGENIKYVAALYQLFWEKTHPEREALIAFYNNTDGDNWNNNSGWLGEPGTECYWYGVKCSAGSIVEINLGYNNLSGTLPPEIANLTDLSRLDLHGNQISDISPLDNMSSLIELELWKNQISDISPLANMSNLELLRIFENPISDFSPLTSLTNLAYLQLDNISDISLLANLTNLTSLSVCCGSINDISPLASLTNLTYLNLADNQISDISPLANLTNLTTLHVPLNQISDISPMANLTNLTQSNLWGNQISDISPLASLTNLTYLHLADNQISDISPLANLTNLYYLNLVDNQISDISPLANLTILYALHVLNNPLSCDSILKYIPTLLSREVWVSWTNDGDSDHDDDGIVDDGEDKNGNGVVDGDETDPCLADTDGDGIQDGTELGYTLADVGPDTDLGVFIPDADPNTTTDPLNSDTDGDGLSDGQEDTNHNGMFDPGELDPNHISGDVDGDMDVDLSDAILALQVGAGIQPFSTVHKKADVNADGKIGLEEAIYILQKISGIIKNTDPIKSPWPMPSHDPQHMGLSPYIGTQTSNLLWQFQIEGGFRFTPTIGSDGTIYINGLSDATLYAIKPEGTLRWSFKPESGGIFREPSIGSNGTIYATGGGKLYAITPDGNLKWKLQYTAYEYGSSLLTIGSDGTVYATDGTQGGFYAVAPDGTLKWSYDTGYSITNTPPPAVGIDGTIYAVCVNGLFALSPDGTLRWSYPVTSWTRPTVGPDGTIYIGASNNLHAFNSDGTLKWIVEGIATNVDASTVIGSNGTIYVADEQTRGAQLSAVSPDGTVKWRGHRARGTPAIGADSTIYVNFEAINPDSTQKWSYGIPGDYRDEFAEPAIASDGTVYFSAPSGLYAFGESEN